MATQEQRLRQPDDRQLRRRALRLWRQLQSMTFAIIMLSIILLVIIAGSFLPQNNGIHYVYESWWFYGLNIVLMASVVSCVSRRAGSVIRFAFKVPVVHRESFYRAGDTARGLASELDQQAASQAVVRALRKRHYRVVTEADNAGVHILADRFRVFRLGTLVSHTSIVLLVATIVWGSFAGWLDQGILLEAGGDAVSVGHGTGLMLRSDSFNFGLYPNGTPRNFHDHLTLTAGDGASYHQVIDVNTPWYFRGLFGFDIHQASYGMTARLFAIDARNQVQPYCLIQLGNTNCSKDFLPMLMVPLGDGSYNPAGGSQLSAFYLPNQKLAISVTTHDPVPLAKLPETVVVTVLRPPEKAGQAMQILKEQADLPVSSRTFNGRQEDISQPLDVAGLKMTVLTKRLSSVNVGHNPAVPFIFTAFTLIIVGLVSVLYFPFTRLWFLVIPEETDGARSTVLMRGSAEKSRQGFRRRFEILSTEAQRELQRDYDSRTAERPQ